MKTHIFLFCFVFLSVLTVKAQEDYTYDIIENISFPMVNDFDPMKVAETESGLHRVPRGYPKPNTVKEANKRIVNQIRTVEGVRDNPDNRPMRRSAVNPIVTKGFSGSLQGGIPNDNNIAVSSTGWVVSVLNTFIRVYDEDGNFKKNWTLEIFPRAFENEAPGDGVEILDRSYDPKIVYDPVANRFIIVYLEGSESSDTRIIVAFSKSDNPLDGWRVYQIDGKPMGGKVWSDYPIIGISAEDLYITVNILKDSTDWRDGFQQSIIWQIPKSDGYTGKAQLRANLFQNLKYQNKPIWSICVIPSGFLPFEKGMLFLSVRPGDVQNDTVFLHRINANFSDGNPSYSLEVLKTDKPYGLPPDAYQPQAGFRLQSNDARVLSGFFHANKIQYVQTTRDFQTNKAAVYHGIISNVYDSSKDPAIKGKIIVDDSCDIAYPSMVYAGDGNWNDNAIITFSHSSVNHYPGTSVIYMNGGLEYSEIIKTKTGVGLINTFLPDSMERWGDYTGIQRNYSLPGGFWLSGSFGDQFNKNGTWVNHVQINDMNVGEEELVAQKQTHKAFPNPVSDVFRIQFQSGTTSDISCDFRDVNGKVVYSKFYNQVQEGDLYFDLNVSGYAPGIYFYTIHIKNTNQQINGKFIIQ